jgi:hypothetical protein
MTSIASEIFDLDPGVHLVTLSGPQAALQGVFVSLTLLELGGGEPARDNAPERHKILRGLGESWKVEVGSNVKLLISVVAPTPEIRSTLAVTVEALADRSGGPPDEHAGDVASERPSTDLLLVAHLSKQGDATFRAADWIGGPARPARIEGLSIDWPACPSEVALAYRVAMANGTRTNWLARGQFAGSRGRNLPITSLSLSLSGPAAAEWRLVAEAMFQGGSGQRPERQSTSGATVMLSGKSGREALVGLRLSIEPSAAAAPVAIADPAPQVPAPDATPVPQASVAPAAQPPQPQPQPAAPKRVQPSDQRILPRVKIIKSPAGR